jgi:hypothetical protein
MNNKQYKRKIGVYGKERREQKWKKITENREENER